MRSFHFRLILIICTLVLLLTAVPAETTQTTYSTQTIMVYIIGSDLESDYGMATADILEMLRAKPDTERLNVLVMTGGTTRWTERSIPANKLSVFHIQGNRPLPVQDSPPANMGEAQTLSQFLAYGVEHYPADSYGLVLWNHGGGPLVGFGVDTAHQGDGLSLLELRQALLDSPFGSGRRLEWLAFDACLMASVEVAALMQPFARYMIASEETLPGEGFDYGFLGAVSGGGLTGPEVAHAIIDETWDHYAAAGARNPRALSPVTLSLLDLDNVAPVISQLDQLFAEPGASLGEEQYSELARIRDRTKDYGRTTTTNSFDLIDLNDLARNLAPLYPQQAQALRQAIRNMVLYSRSNTPNTHGLSAYFPLRNKDRYKSTWGKQYKDLGIAEGYTGFMGRFAQILLTDRLSNWSGKDAPAVMFDQLSGEYFIQLSPQQAMHFERAEYYVLAHLNGDEYMLSYMSSDTALDPGHRLFANYDGKTMYLQHPQTAERIVPYMRETENIDGVSRYQIPAVFGRTAQDGQYESVPGEMLAEVNKTNGSARIIGAIRSADEDQYTGKLDLDLSQWSFAHLIYTSMYLTRDAQGDMLALGDWVPSALPRVITYALDEELILSYEPLEEDVYDHHVILSVVDTQGFVYTSDLMPLNGPDPAAPQSLHPAPLKAVSIDFDPQQSRRTLLFEKDGLSVTLAGTEQSEDLLTLHLLASNERPHARNLLTTWAAINGLVLPAELSGEIPGEGQALLRMDIPLTDAENGSPVQKYGVSRPTVLSLRFVFSSQQSLMIHSQYSPRIDVRLEAEREVHGAVPGSGEEDRVILAEDSGLRILLGGPPELTEDALVVPLVIRNDSDVYDSVKLAHSSVNGIMAPLTLDVDVPPGTVRHTRAVINRYRTILPPEMAEYQYMFDGVDNLEAVGISHPEQIRLYFELDAREYEGKQGRASRVRALKDVIIPFPGQTAERQAVDSLGETLLKHRGIVVTRLHSDPLGRRFLIQNHTPFLLYLHTFGHVLADGTDYGYSAPLVAYAVPGAVAYAQLFGFLPGVEPDAKELSFYINLIDLNENRLIHRSERTVLQLEQPAIETLENP